MIIIYYRCLLLIIMVIYDYHLLPSFITDYCCHLLLIDYLWLLFTTVINY